MIATRRDISLGFTEVPVQEGQHICYLFNDDEERCRIMSRFIESGLRSGEKVLYLVDTMPTMEFIDSMKALGLDIGAHSPNFVLEDAGPVYCQDGRFSCNRMLDLVGRFYVDSQKEGYSGALGARRGMRTERRRDRIRGATQSSDANVSVYGVLPVRRAAL
jgi:hypothetical protein